MNFIPVKTKEGKVIEGLVEIKPKIFPDPRGRFLVSYNYNLFKQNKIPNVFVQDNQSDSVQGVIRGLHFQTGEFAQAKLVRALRGRILDVALDLRPGPTFGEYASVILNADEQNMLFIPRGFAHGFSVLSGEAIFFYKCDNDYNPAAEGGIIYNDPFLKINWGAGDNPIVSDKDKLWPTFSEWKRLNLR